MLGRPDPVTRTEACNLYILAPSEGCVIQQWKYVSRAIRRPPLNREELPGRLILYGEYHDLQYSESH